MGSYFAFRSILRNRVPRTRKDSRFRFTADILPRRLNASRLIGALPRGALDLHAPKDYGKTTGEWLNRLRKNEKVIRATWGEQVYVDYERYLDTCVRAFAAHWSGDVQMKLRRIE